MTPGRVALSRIRSEGEAHPPESDPGWLGILDPCHLSVPSPSWDAPAFPRHLHEAPPHGADPCVPPGEHHLSWWEVFSCTGPNPNPNPGTNLDPQPNTSSMSSVGPRASKLSALRRARMHCLLSSPTKQGDRAH